MEEQFVMCMCTVRFDIIFISVWLWLPWGRNKINN